ncbi:MAG: zinc metalloprotease HtpX [Nitrospirae bacterium]|nr:zinc metalloprotease HtpX [Nitrospirota bacterium]MBI3351769.1 zinc metalloprotease HtpX [Nitrospirota bacterium]
MNNLKTTFLLVFLTLLLIFVGGAIGGRGGMMIAFVMAMGMNLISYWFSDKIVLAMYRAKEVSQNDAPELYNTVSMLASRAEIPMPRIYIIDNPTPNAFATGRNPQHAAVAVTTGILNVLNREELAGVLGHELAHVEHRDILISTIAAAIAGAISMIANMAQWGLIFGGGRNDREGSGGLVGSLLMIIVAPIAAMLVQMAVSRSREFEADRGGAIISGNPMSLANALRKLDRASHQIPMDANPATAHMFIVNPLTGGAFFKLFSTHPPMEERIARLENMAISH